MASREIISKQLATLLHGSSDIVLYGSSGSGKSHLLRAVLASEQLSHLTLSCALLPSTFLLLQQLASAYKLSASSPDQLFCKELTDPLRSSLRVLVFDRAEKMLHTRDGLITLLTLRIRLKIEVLFVFVCLTYPKDAMRKEEIAAMDYLPVPLMVPQLPLTIISEELCRQCPGQQSELRSFLTFIHPVLSAYSGNIAVYDLAIRQLYPLYRLSTRDSSFHASIKSFCEDIFLAGNLRVSEFLDTPQQLLAISAFIASRTDPRLDRSQFKRMPHKHSQRQPKSVQRLIPIARLLAIFDTLYFSLYSSHYGDSMRLGANIGRLVEKKLIVPVSSGLTEKLVSLVCIEEALEMCKAVGLRLSDYIHSDY